MSALTILGRVEKMFPKVAAKHPFPQDPTLLQLLLAGSGLHEGPQECDQLAVFSGHCTDSMRSTLLQESQDTWTVNWHKHRQTLCGRATQKEQILSGLESSMLAAMCEMN